MTQGEPRPEAQRPEEPRLVPAGVPAWISRELVEKTIRVWQRYYPKPLTPDDAVTMLLNVGRLFTLLSRGSVP